MVRNRCSRRALSSWLRGTLFLGVVALGTSPAVAADPSSEVFQPPMRLLAGDQLVDTAIGHAAPYLADLDQDGKLDLLVGQFEGGMLRIYKNTGTNEKPAYAQFQYFQVGGKDVKVPTG